MRRKYFCRVAALGMAMAVLTGCGGKSVNEMGGQTEELAKTTAEESGQKQTGGSTITWWTWSTEAKDIYEAYAAAVTEKYPEITVKLEFMGYDDYWTKLPVAIAGGTGPDIYQMTRPSFELYAASNQAADITEMIAGNENLKQNMEQMDPVLVEGYQFEGKQMGFPYTVESTAIVYNKNMFLEAGLAEPKEIEDTWTWADLRDMAKQLTKKGESAANSQYGFFCGSDKIPSWEILLSRGKWIFSEDMTECTMADPDIVDSLGVLMDMYREDGVSPTSDVMNAMSENDLFMTGRIAMMATGSWNLTTFSKIEGFEWDCAELPLDVVTGKRVSSSNVLGYIVNPNSKNMEAVGKVLEVFTSREAQEQLAETGTYIPAVVEARDAYFEADKYPENAKAFQRALDYVHPNLLTQFIPYSEYMTMYKDAMKRAYEGEDLGVVLQDTEDKVNKIVMENKENFK